MEGNFDENKERGVMWKERNFKRDWEGGKDCLKKNGHEKRKIERVG